MATGMVTDMAMARERSVTGVSFVRTKPVNLAGRPLAAVIAASLLSFQAQGQEGDAGGGRPAWLIVPRVSITETITDNGALSQGTRGKQGDQITQVSPGVQIQGQSGRARGYLDYSLNQIVYAQESGQNQTQNALTAFGTLEAVEKWLFVDATGSISQTAISAFGAQSSSNTSINSNSTETSTFRLSPYIKGQLLSFADYQVRYDRVASRSQSNLASDSDSEAWTASLNGNTPLSSLGWSLSGSRQTVDYTLGRKTEADRFYGMLIWQVSPQFKLKGSGGQEANNYVSLDKETKSTHGYGFDWAPTERTLVSWFRENRFFGDGHQFTFTHRTPLTSWRFTDSRDVTAMNQSGNVGLGTIYDLVLAMIPATITDPAQRAARANELIFLFGLPRNAVVNSNFLTAQATLARRRELSFIITGVNNTVTFTASESRQESLSSRTITLFRDSFSMANVIDQRGFGVNWSHRISAMSSLMAGVMKTNTSGSGGRGGDINSNQKSLNVSFSTRLGPKTGASLGLRRTVFDSDASSGYTENALTGTLTAQF